MEEIDLKLARDCEALAGAAGEAMRWIKDAAASAPSIGQRAGALSGALQRARNQSRKLARAARRKMCVGVFGPSQAGKSYLVSILASREGRPLQARLGERTYDFLKEINPPGGRESTGLVTRLTVDAADAPPGYPVELRLLTQTDLVKILANSFHLDFDHQKADTFRRPTGEEVRDRIQELRKVAQPGPVEALDEDDVLDLVEYFDTYFKGVSQEFHGNRYWHDAMELAPRLAGADRARLWSLLWYDYAPYTKLYLDLFDGLRRLGFADEAHCTIDALTPREKSIIDVLTLDRLGADDADPIKVRPRAAGAAEALLPRSLVCALTAELRIAIGDKPWRFFDHADLLDFPGARSRLKLERLEDAGRGAEGEARSNPLRELLLRGKVAYLFQRYSAEREMSAILLCIPDSVQEVRDLSPMMEAWVASTFGSTPEARARHLCGLFLVLTKMDREFEEKAGQDDARDLPLRWTARLNNSLLNNFRGEWPRNWDGKPFRNAFWLRNPTYKDERVMAYAGERETGLAPAFEARRFPILRSTFVANEQVRQCFAEPERAWDEAFRPNDGGLAYLVEKLDPVCDPAIKRAQVRGQLDEQAARVVDGLAGFHNGNDSDARQKKQALVQQVLRGLGPCIKTQRFGELVAALHVEPEDLRAIYFRSAAPRANGADGKPAPSAPRGPAKEAVGAAVDLGDIFGEVFGEDAAPRQGPSPAAETLRDRPHRFADQSVELWLERIKRLSADERAARHFGLTTQHFGWLVDELSVGGSRIRLAEGLADRLRAVENAANAKWEDIAERQVRVASGAINGFVDWLGFDRVERDKRPGLPPQAPTRRVFEDPPPVAGGPRLSEEPAPIYNTFCADWLRAFLQMALDNVGFEGGREITPEQNDRLGAILRKAEAARAAA